VGTTTKKGVREIVAMDGIIGARWGAHGGGSVAEHGGRESKGAGEKQ